jgi:protein lifeguard
MTDTCKYDDLERGVVGFDDAAQRQGFTRKVLAHVCWMLGVVFAINVAAFHAPAVTQTYLQGQGGWIFWVATIFAFATILGYICHPSIYHHHPQKYVTLLVFAAAMGTMCMYATLQYSASSVLLAAGLTLTVTVGLCAYAHRTSTDFTMMGGGLSSALLLLLVVGLLQIWFRDQLLQTLLAAGGALLFSVYIVYDMQLILGGKHRTHQFSIDDDALAAISLFLDIVNLFLNLLELTGRRE